MNRPFTSADSGKYFRFVGDRPSTASKFVGRIGQLEGFPLMDPGSAEPGEGVLWFGPEGDRDGWAYVSPSEVEPVTL